eukprot:g6711.t1
MANLVRDRRFVQGLESTIVMAPPIIGNAPWIFVKVSSVGAGVVLLNAAVNWSEKLLFDGIRPLKDIHGMGAKSFSSVIDDARLARRAMKDFGCFFLDYYSVQNATRQINGIFDVTFGKAYRYLGKLAEYLFGNKNAKALPKPEYRSDETGAKEKKEATKKPGKMQALLPTAQTIEVLKHLSYLSVSTVTLGISSAAFVSLFSFKCLCNPRLTFLGSVRAATCTLFILAHPVHSYNLVKLYAHEIKQTLHKSKTTLLENGPTVVERKEVFVEEPRPSTPVSNESLLVVDKLNSILKVRVVKAINLQATGGFFGFWQKTRNLYVEVYVQSSDSVSKQVTLRKIGRTSNRGDTVNPSWEHSDEVLEYEVLGGNVGSNVEKVVFKIFSENSSANNGAKHLGDAFTEIPLPIDDDGSHTFLQRPNTTPVGKGKVHREPDETIEDGFVLSEDAVDVDIDARTIKNVDTLEKIPSFDSMLERRELLVTDPNGTGTQNRILTIDIGHMNTNCIVMSKVS